MKKIYLMVLFLILSSGLVYAESNEVEIVIPEFTVTMNNSNYNSQEAKYPLINYKGITYFPMTWNLSQSLGLTTKYNNIDGLSIDLGKSNGELKFLDGGSNQFNRYYSATMPNYPITVNGALIDNSKEDYPVLSFRSITYFPLTWRFAVEEFKWDYKYSSENGLAIGATTNTSETSGNNTSESTDDFTVEDNGTIVISETFQYDDLIENTYGITKYIGFAHHVTEQQTIIFHNKNVNWDGYYFDQDTSFYNDDKLLYTLKSYGSRYFSNDTTNRESGSGLYGAPLIYDHVVFTVKLYPPELFKKMNDDVATSIEVVYIKSSEISKALLIRDGGFYTFGAAFYNRELSSPDTSVYAAANSRKTIEMPDGEYKSTGNSPTDHVSWHENFYDLSKVDNVFIKNSRFGYSTEYDEIEGTNAQAILLLDKDKNLIKIYINLDSFNDDSY